MGINISERTVPKQAQRAYTADDVFMDDVQAVMIGSGRH